MKMPKQKLERPVFRALTRLAILILALGAALGVYVAVQIADANERYRYRLEDSDGDAIADAADDDVDGDGLLNIEDEDADDDGTNNWEQAAGAAEDLVGRRVDLLEGRYGNLGVKMGMLRPADVVLLAYERAGVYLVHEIEQDAGDAPEAYARAMRDGRVDAHDAVALWTYADRRGWLTRPWHLAGIGDMILFDKGQVALVVDADEQTHEVVWANGDLGRVERTDVERISRHGFSPAACAVIGD